MDEDNDKALARLLHDALEAHDVWSASDGQEGKRFSVTKNPELRRALELMDRYDYSPLTNKPWERLCLSDADLEGMHLSRTHLARANFFAANLRRATLEMSTTERVFSFFTNADLSHAKITGCLYDLAGLGCLSQTNLHEATLDVLGIDLRQVFEARNLATARLPNGKTSLPVFVQGPTLENGKTPSFVRVSSLVLASGKDGRLRFSLDPRPLGFNDASAGEKRISLKDTMKAFFSSEILDGTPDTPQGYVDLLNRTPNLVGQTLESSGIEIVSVYRSRPEPS